MFQCLCGIQELKTKLRNREQIGACQGLEMKCGKMDEGGQKVPVVKRYHIPVIRDLWGDNLQQGDCN